MHLVVYAAPIIPSTSCSSVVCVSSAVLEYRVPVPSLVVVGLKVVSNATHACGLTVQVKEESGLPWMLVLAPTVPLPSSCSTAYPFNEPREGSTVMHQVPRCHRCHGSGHALVVQT